MADIVDANTRSRMMAGIRGKNTNPELLVRKAMHAQGLRFRLHRKDLPGKPDIVFPRQKSVVFIHGCFWHRHEGCHYTTTPKTRSEFWQNKFGQNVLRDQRNLAALEDKGWRHRVVWECEIKAQGADVIAKDIQDWLCKPFS